MPVAGRFEASHDCNLSGIDCPGRTGLCAVIAGKSNKEIGVALDNSEATVEVHMTHILDKFKVTSRTEAIRFAAGLYNAHFYSP